MRILNKDMQLLNEQTYSQKGIDKLVREEYEANPDVIGRVQQGVQLLTEWLNPPEPYYASKQARLDQIKSLNLEELVWSVFLGTAYCQTEELFTGVSAMLASRLGMNDKKEAIHTCAEILAVLCYTDAYDLIKPSKYAQLYVKSNLELSDELLNQIAMGQYLPPMLIKPRDVHHNRDNPHLTYNDSLVLGKGNHHDGDLCLDVINSKNQVALRLDTDYLCSVEETPKNKPTDHLQIQQWNTFKRQSYKVYEMLVKANNEFYLTHKYDKRGRMYAQGYHVSTQGTSFKKASIELAKQEIVTGVPSWTVQQTQKTKKSENVISTKQSA